jgi:hypothetical protein
VYIYSVVSLLLSDSHSGFHKFWQSLMCILPNTNIILIYKNTACKLYSKCTSVTSVVFLSVHISLLVF